MPVRSLFAPLLLVALVVSTLGGSAISAQAQQERFFPDTGFSVADDDFWDYFQRRGGTDTFGQPVSRKFILLGSEVQFFQRLVMQKTPNGSVTTLNLLDVGLMPVTHINGSVFPAPERELTENTPIPSEPDYGTRIVAFVAEQAPDEWQGLAVNFHQTFNNVVSFEDAFPDGSGDASLLPLLNLEVWGAPTSRALDPNNGEFVYQRFQRVIAHYDRGCGCTRALLLADWFKSVLTGRELPPDLAAEMQGSPFYQQYDLSKSNGVARPDQLPNSNMLFAFEREDRPVPNVQTSPPTTPGATGSPTVGSALDSIQVLSTDLAQDPVSKRWIGYGEVQNTSSSPAVVSLRLNVFAVNGRPIATLQEEASVSPLGPGQISPFRLDFGRLPEGVDHFTTEAFGVVAQTPGVNGLKISNQRLADDGVQSVITGVVENRTGDSAKELRLAVSFFNQDNELLDVWQGTPVFSWVDDGAQVAFQAATTFTDPDDVAGYTVYVGALRGAPTPEPEDDVAVFENTRVAPSNGLLRVFGEVESTTDDAAVDVSVGALFYDADNNIVAVGSGKPLPVRLPPESEAPLMMELPAPPDGYDHVEYQVFGQRYAEESSWPIELDVTDAQLDAVGDVSTLTGKVKNDSDDDAHDAFVVVAFYNASGKIVDVVSDNLVDTDLGEGDETEFEVSTNVDSVASARAMAFGYRE